MRLESLGQARTIGGNGPGATAAQPAALVRPVSTISLLGLAWRAMVTAVAAVADIDPDAWQAQAAAGHQECRQYDGRGASHDGLRFHWNTPEFPDGRQTVRDRKSVV